MNWLKTFWPDLESNRAGEWEGWAKRERENEKLRERKKAYHLGEEFTYFLQQKL